MEIKLHNTDIQALCEKLKDNRHALHVVERLHMQHLLAGDMEQLLNAGRAWTLAMWANGVHNIAPDRETAEKIHASLTQTLKEYDQEEADAEKDRAEKAKSCYSFAEKRYYTIDEWVEQFGEEALQYFKPGGDFYPTLKHTKTPTGCP